MINNIIMYYYYFLNVSTKNHVNTWMNIYKKTIVNDSRNLKNNFKMIYFF